MPALQISTGPRVPKVPKGSGGDGGDGTRCGEVGARVDAPPLPARCIFEPDRERMKNLGKVGV